MDFWWHDERHDGWFTWNNWNGKKSLEAVGVKITTDPVKNVNHKVYLETR